jgi:hypothetical protein
MKSLEDQIFDIAEMLADANAAGRAALEHDFDEVRFRAHLVVGKAKVLGLASVALLAGALLADLGTGASTPLPGYSLTMIRLAEELDQIDLGSL